MEPGQYNLEEWCILCQQADDLLSHGQIDSALAALHALLAKIEESRALDTLPIAKAVLSILICHTLRGEIQLVSSIVRKQMETDDSVEAIGVFALEKGTTEVHDLMIYYTVLANMYSCAGANKDRAAENINSYMTTICNYSLEKDQTIFPSTLINWRVFLNSLAEGAAIPSDWLTNFNEFMGIYGHGLPPTTDITLLRPTPWSLIARPTSGTVFGPDGSITTKNADGSITVNNE